MGNKVKNRIDIIPTLDGEIQYKNLPSPFLALLIEAYQIISCEVVEKNELIVYLHKKDLPGIDIKSDYKGTINKGAFRQNIDS
jgi:hypothetical protein